MFTDALTLIGFALVLAPVLSIKFPTPERHP
ncbi:MAG: hypothetical protein GAK38_02926 [Xylophilus sp.]|nr:MAG: hypothetical protein GAK38_02926 [Xylophilus sp.]